VIEGQKMDQQLIELVNDLRISIINLREEKQFTESVIQSLHHGLLVTDLQGNIIKSNDVARRIMEPFVDDLDGRSLQAVIGSAHAEMLTADGQDATGYAGQDATLSTGDGQEVILSISGAPRKDARGNHVGYIVSLLDVTELRYARREMEKMNRLSTVAEIASAVAHEVRNPLAGIKIMAQSIEEDAVGNEQQLECSRRIIRQVDRLNELLSEFFSYARPVIPNKRPISIRSIVAETRPLINNRLMKNSIDLIEDIAPDLPNVIADPNQMQQVFLNLMLNATDAIRQNGTITISARLLVGHKLSMYKKRVPGLLTDNRYVLVVFSDNGAGMPANVVEKVFEPFFTTKSTGTGLGLSIVYRTLRENGAAISLESQPGKGTTFNMFFQTGA
jgi:PAS domain S-box-containing protein